VFPVKLFPGDIVLIEKASFILCCSRQAVSYNWINKALDYPILIGLILSEPEKSFLEIVFNDDWMMTDKEKKEMYNVYVCGKIIKLDKSCIGDVLQ
jgi:hypothetical protein